MGQGRPWVVFMTLFSENDYRSNGYSAGESSIQWAEQYLHLESHLQWKKKNGNHFAMLWTNQIEEEV